MRTLRHSDFARLHCCLWETEIKLTIWPWSQGLATLHYISLLRLCASFKIDLPTTLGGRHHSHFTDERIEAQRASVTCPRSNNKCHAGDYKAGSLALQPVCSPITLELPCPKGKWFTRNDMISQWMNLALEEAGLCDLDKQAKLCIQCTRSIWRCSRDSRHHTT